MQAAQGPAGRVARCLGAFAVTFVVYFWNLDMKLTSVMEGILLKHYDKIDRDQHL